MARLLGFKKREVGPLLTQLLPQRKRVTQGTMCNLNRGLEKIHLSGPWFSHLSNERAELHATLHVPNTLGAFTMGKGRTRKRGTHFWLPSANIY